jgi:hypothetical protein
MNSLTDGSRELSGLGSSPFGARWNASMSVKKFFARS